MRLTVVITNGGEPESLQALAQKLSTLEVGVEILVVDREGAAAEAVAEQVGGRFVSQKGESYGDALRVGFAEASGDYVLTLDVRDPDLEWIASVWKKRAEAELWTATRFLRGGPGKSKGPAPKLLDRVGGGLLRRALDLPYRDYANPTRLYKAEALRRIRSEGRGRDVLPELIVRLHMEGYRIKELPSDPKGKPLPGIVSLLPSLPRLRRLRRSKLSADYEDRSSQSRNRLERNWLKRRHQIVIGYLEVDVPALDVGCGSSRVIQTLSKGTGLDSELKKLRFLRGRVKALSAGNVRALPFRDESFRQIVCTQLVEHLAPDVTDDSFLTELHRVLVPGGTLVLGATDSSSARGRMYQSLRRLLGSGEPPPRTRYNQKLLRDRLAESGFTVDELKTIHHSEMLVRAVRKNPS